MDDKVLKNIILVGDKLNNEYLKAGSFSKQKRIAFDLCSYDDFCNEMLGINNKHKWYMMDDFIPDNDYLLEVLNRDKKCFFDLSKGVINSFIEEGYSLYRNYGKVLPKLNYKEMKDALKGFLKDFDLDLFDKFDNKSKGYRVLETEMDYEGFILPFESIKDSFILINNNSDNHNLSFMVTLAHECGHLFEIEHLYSQDNISFRSNSMMSPYCEVSSNFFEYAFLMYLKENKLFEHSTDLCLDEYYMRLFVFNFCMNLISMKNDISTSFGCVYIDEDNIKMYADYIMNRVNYYGMIGYDNGLDFRDSYIYGIGSLFAIYMYDKYKDNKLLFKNELKKCFLRYPVSSDIGVFRDVGIDFDTMKDGKVLRRILRDRKE